MSAMERHANPVSHYREEVITRDFYGTLFSASGFSWVKPDKISIFIQEPALLAVTNFPSGEPESSSLYDESYLQKKDKYSYFLGGSTPLVRIETENKNAPSLLVVRDSFLTALRHFYWKISRRFTSLTSAITAPAWPAIYGGMILTAFWYATA